MKSKTKELLERAGWTVGSTIDFLGLTEEEASLIELKLALADGVRRFREKQGLTQAGLAKRLGSSQSRVAKIEAGDRSVSTDLMLRSLFSIGAKPADIARLIKGTGSRREA